MNPTGKYTILKVKLTNWDTNRFLMYLSRYLRISRKRITYCGTKDKRGITTQYFCVNSEIQPERIGIKDAEILDSFRTDRMLNLGDSRSLVVHPASTTHRQLGPDDLAAVGITPDMIRLSLGLEHIDDLLEDLDQALAVAHRA